MWPQIPGPDGPKGGGASRRIMDSGPPISQGTRKLILLCPGRRLGTHPDGPGGGGGPEGRGSPIPGTPPAPPHQAGLQASSCSVLMTMKVVWRKHGPSGQRGAEAKARSPRPAESIEGGRGPRWAHRPLVPPQTAHVSFNPVTGATRAGGAGINAPWGARATAWDPSPSPRLPPSASRGGCLQSSVPGLFCRVWGCIYVCACVCISVCVSMCACGCVYGCVFVCIWAYICVCCVCTCICVYLCVHV